MVSFRPFSGSFPEVDAYLLLTAFALVVGAAVAFAVRTLSGGPVRDPEIETRETGPMLGKRLQVFFSWSVSPLWKLVVLAGLPPTAVTSASILFAAASAVSIATGRFAAGGWLLLASGLCDFLDGRVARHTARASRRGAALDSVLDRYVDSAPLVGLAWFYRDSLVLLPILFALSGSFLVAYVRARGEALGVASRTVGLMQRPERLVVLCTSLIVAPLADWAAGPPDSWPRYSVAVLGVALLAISTQWTALQRFAHVLSALDTRSGNASAGIRVIGAGISSALATAIDFGLVTTMVSGWAWHLPLATAVGSLIGAALNFFLNRIWAVDPSGRVLPQVTRYWVVSATSAAFNAGGVAVATWLPEVDYRVSWWVVRALVFLCWNFPLHREYVFEEPEASLPGEPSSEGSPSRTVGLARRAAS